jgi:Glycerophosphoryl diester phosphodiesterase family
MGWATSVQSLVVALCLASTAGASAERGPRTRPDSAVGHYRWAKRCLLDPSCADVLFAAHRQGYSHTVGENSLWAFERRIGSPFIDIMELDVRETRDGALILMHDRDVDRTTDGHGRVRDLTLEQIQQLRLRGLDEPPPTLDAVAELAEGTFLLMIDPKDSSLRKIWRSVTRHQLEDQAILLVNGDRHGHVREINALLDEGARPIFMPRLHRGDRVPEFLARFHARPLLVHLDRSSDRETIAALREAGIRAYDHLPGRPWLGLGWKARGRRAIDRGPLLFDTNHPRQAAAVFQEYRRSCAEAPMAVR